MVERDVSSGLQRRITEASIGMASLASRSVSSGATVSSGTPVSPERDACCGGAIKALTGLCPRASLSPKATVATLPTVSSITCVRGGKGRILEDHSRRAVEEQTDRGAPNSPSGSSGSRASPSATATATATREGAERAILISSRTATSRAALAGLTIGAVHAAAVVDPCASDLELARVRFRRTARRTIRAIWPITPILTVFL